MPPFAGLHGHTFSAKLTVGGPVDEPFGRPANLYEVESFIKEVKGEHGSGLDHGNLDRTSEIGVGSLENIAKYLWTLFHARFPGLEEVELKRGFPGKAEGCLYRGEATADHKNVA